MRTGHRYLRDAAEAGLEVGIKPFLMWGTLLGHVRGGDFIPGDRDIDFGIRSEDYAKKDAFIAAMRRRGYRVDWDAPYKIRFSRRRRELHIDVDVFYPWDGRMICCARLPDGSLSGEAFESATFDNLKPVIFADRVSTYIPDPPEPVLNAIYGEWQTPCRLYASSTGPLNRIAFAPDQAVPALEADSDSHRAAH